MRVPSFICITVAFHFPSIEFHAKSAQKRLVWDSILYSHCSLRLLRSGTPSTGTLRRSVSASSELSEGTAMGNTSRQASQSTGNLTHYGRKPVLYQEETASVRSFHSTTGDTVLSAERSTQRSRRHSESDAEAEPQGPVYYRDVTLERLENESFGFVIFSSVQKSGSTIGTNVLLILYSEPGCITPE